MARWGRRLVLRRVVVIGVPSHVGGERLGHGGGAVASVHCCVVFEAVAADAAHEALEAVDADNGAGAKGLERIVGEVAVADIGANDAGGIVCADAAEGDGAGGCASFERADCVLFSEHGAENGRGGDANVWQEVLCPVSAMEEDAAVRVVAVVVVPVYQRAGAAAG